MHTSMHKHVHTYTSAHPCSYVSPHTCACMDTFPPMCTHIFVYTQHVHTRHSHDYHTSPCVTDMCTQQYHMDGQCAPWPTCVGAFLGLVLGARLGNTPRVSCSRETEPKEGKGSCRVSWPGDGVELEIGPRLGSEQESELGTGSGPGLGLWLGLA